MTTNSQGTIQITPTNYVNAPSNINDIAVYVLPETPKFIVARDNDSGSSLSTIAIVESLGTLGSIFGNPGLSNPAPYIVTLSSATTEYEIFRAADYYYTDSHYLTDGISSAETGIVFLAHDQSFATSGVLGSADVVNKIVNIYNLGLGMQENLSTTLHELGHIRHFEKNHVIYQSSNDFVLESYASFVGWILGEQYYFSKGYVKPSHNYQITLNWRQNWHKNLTPPMYNYSPIFIDLWDNFNQSAEYYTGISETIFMVPIPIIEGMTVCTSLSECLNYLEGYIDTYLTQNAYNSLVTYYQ